MSIAPSPRRSGLVATTFFTTGYEQSEPEKFLRRLQLNSVETIIDVRDVPLSRKRGFSKNQLQSILAEIDIDYMHIKPLGAPREIRDALRAGGSWWDYVKAYEAVLRLRQVEVEELCRLAAQKRICLLCFERNPAECHRSLIARKMETIARHGELRVEHIRY